MKIQIFQLLKGLCLFSSVFVFSSFSQAFEYLSLINKECEVRSGFIVDNKEDQLSLLNEQGSLDNIPISDVDQIVVHNLLEFPFSLSLLSSSVVWYQVTLLDQHHSSFRGTPIQFVDQLIFFLNEKGALEVTSFEQIGSIKKIQDRHVAWKGKGPSLDFSAARVRCTDLSAEGMIPSRILNDPIQIDEFLRNFEKGFERFDQLNERMYFYSRPMLVKNTVRMGFAFAPTAAESFDPNYLNFKFSSGVPFGLQSSTVIGSAQNDWIPFYFPTSGASFEIKSHLFHAVLVTHLASISGGSSAFDEFIGTDEFRAPPNYYYRDRSPFIIGNSFNYLTMFGIDIKQWTFSIGGFFPVYYIFMNGETRELLTSTPQLTSRLMYTREKWRLRFDGANYRMNQETDAKHPTLKAYSSWQPLTHLAGKTRGYFFRAGWDWDLTNNIQAKFDALKNHWSYEESSGLRAQASANTYAAAINKEFGRYVNMKVYISYVDYDWNGSFSGVSYNAPLKEQMMGGEFEFIF